MTEDVKNVLGTDEMVVEKKKTPPPPMIWMRWSKVLNRWVTCLESDHEAVAYMKVR